MDFRVAHRSENLRFDAAIFATTLSTFSSSVLASLTGLMGAVLERDVDLVGLSSYVAHRNRVLRQRHNEHDCRELSRLVLPLLLPLEHRSLRSPS